MLFLRCFRSSQKIRPVTPCEVRPSETQQNRENIKTSFRTPNPPLSRTGNYNGDVRGAILQEEITENHGTVEETSIDKERVTESANLMKQIYKADIREPSEFISDYNAHIKDISLNNIEQINELIKHFKRFIFKCLPKITSETDKTTIKLIKRIENSFDSLIASKLKSTEAVRQGQRHNHISKKDLDEENKKLQDLFNPSLPSSLTNYQLFEQFFKILEATRQRRATNAAQYQAEVNEHYESIGKPAVRVKTPNYQIIKPYTDLVNLDTYIKSRKK